jgi:cytosine/adenosine deaminase-related metal-dependent hydrolase
MASIMRSTAAAKFSGSSRAGSAGATAAMFGYSLAGRVRYWISQDGRSAQQHLNGRIAPGYRADLTAFAASPLHTPAADLPAVPVTLTTVDGLIRHRGVR